MKIDIITKKIITLTLLAFLLPSFLLACSLNINNDVETEMFIPEAANQFAIDKETETTAIEETKAHHIYESIKVPVDTEIAIGERNFLTQINYIRENIEKFQNSNIIVEGMYGFYESWDDTFKFPMVYRNGPGCCGDDQYGGFYLVNIDQTAYNIDDWIKVRGKPFMYDHTDSEGEVQKYMFLLVENLDVLPVKDRKAEMVNN